MTEQCPNKNSVWMSDFNQKTADRLLYIYLYSVGFDFFHLELIFE